MSPWSRHVYAFQSWLTFAWCPLQQWTTAEAEREAPWGILIKIKTLLIYNFLHMTQYKLAVECSDYCWGTAMARYLIMLLSVRKGWLTSSRLLTDRKTKKQHRVKILGKREKAMMKLTTVTLELHGGGVHAVNANNQWQYSTDGSEHLTKLKAHGHMTTGLVLTQLKRGRRLGRISPAHFLFTCLRACFLFFISESVFILSFVYHILMFIWHFHKSSHQ